MNINDIGYKLIADGTITMLKFDIDEEYGDFLGEYKIYIETENYSNATRVVIECTDGRKYIGEIDIFFIYNNKFPLCIENLKRKIEKAYVKSLPYMDRKMRKMYHTFYLEK